MPRSISSPLLADDQFQAPSQVPTHPTRCRLTDINGLLQSHRQLLCLTLSLAVGCISLMEPLLAHAARDEGWLLPSALVSVGCFINAALARGRYAGATTHALVLLLLCFVTIQMAHHTGISWAFVLPPLVLFLHPPQRGLGYLLGGALIVTIGFTLAHVPLNLRDREPFEFWASFLAVTAVSALVGRDLGATINVVTLVAFRDPLTGLFQRDIFMELAEHHLEHARRKQGHCSVLAIDIDNMKAVNDRYGHAAGDEVLQALALLLTRELRNSDLIARFGGDEFVVLLTEQDDVQAREIAGRLLERVRDGQEWQRWRDCSALSVSIGLAICPTHGSSLGPLLEAADAALLRAKAMGKQCMCLAAVDA